MKVIITAAGMGSRFISQGIKTPKYLIKANGKTLLEHSLLTLSNFYSYEFIFIFRNLNNKENIEQIINKCIGINGEKILNYKIINIDHLTQGQAETVLCAKDFFQTDDSILIFNIDTCVLNGYLHINAKDINQDIDGIIYTTKANGDHWSFAKTEPNSNRVIEVSEKIRISNNSSIGLYYFNSFKKFYNIIQEKSNDIIKNYKELYIMPIYKYLIDNNENIIIKEIPLSEFVPLGTPNEILDFDKNFILENKNV